MKNKRFVYSENSDIVIIISVYLECAYFCRRSISLALSLWNFWYFERFPRNGISTTNFLFPLGIFEGWEGKLIPRAWSIFIYKCKILKKIEMNRFIFNFLVYSSAMRSSLVFLHSFFNYHSYMSFFQVNSFSRQVQSITCKV